MSSFGVVCNQSDLDHAIADSLSAKAKALSQDAWAATQRLFGLTANAQQPGIDPNAILGMQSSLAFNYGPDSKHTVGHLFDRPVNNRGEGVHAFDTTQSGGDTGPYPD